MKVDMCRISIMPFLYKGHEHPMILICEGHPAVYPPPDTEGTEHYPVSLPKEPVLSRLQFLPNYLLKASN